MDLSAFNSPKGSNSFITIFDGEKLQNNNFSLFRGKMKRTWRRKQRSHSSIWRSLIPNIPSALFLENSASPMHVLKTCDWKFAAASRVVTVVLSTRQSDLFNHMSSHCRGARVPRCCKRTCWGCVEAGVLSWRVGLLGKHDQVLSQTAFMRLLCCEDLDCALAGSDCDWCWYSTTRLEGTACCKPAIQLAEHAPKTARLHPRHTWTWDWEVCAHVVSVPSNHEGFGNLQMWQELVHGKDCSRRFLRSSISSGFIWFIFKLGPTGLSRGSWSTSHTSCCTFEVLMFVPITLPRNEWWRRSTLMTRKVSFLDQFRAVWPWKSPWVLRHETHVSSRE